MALEAKHLYTKKIPPSGTPLGSGTLHPLFNLKMIISRPMYCIKRESKTVLHPRFLAVNSGFLVLDSTLCQWNLDSRFQDFRLRIAWAQLVISKPRIPDSTIHNSTFNYGFQIYLHGEKISWCDLGVMRSLVITVYSVPQKCHHSDCQVLNNSSIHFYFPAQRRRVLDTRGGGGESTPYDGLYEVYERVGISLVELYKG